MNGKHYVGKQATSFQKYDKVGPVTGIALVVDENHEYLSGDQTGYVLEVPCSYGSQAMADALLLKAKGKTYQGYNATNATLDPLAELGDGITIGGLYSILATREVTYGGGHSSDISAPGEKIIRHRYSDGSTQAATIKRRTERQLADTRATITKTAESINLEVAKKVGYDEVISSINQTAEQITIDASKISLEGLVTVNRTFQINEQGYLQCTGGTIGGFTITTSSLYNGMTSLSSTATGVYVGTDGIGLGGGNFKVTSSGTLTALKGKIGNWDITEYGLHNRFEEAGTPYGDITSDISINAPKTSGDNFLYLSFSGSNAGPDGQPGTNTFSVTAQGELYADSAYIKGEVHATSGDFSGKITSREGSIGGFTIGQSSMYNGLSSLSGATNGVYLGTDGIALGGGKFKVTSAGALTSTSGTFSSVTISGSTFSGSLSNATGSVSGITGSLNGVTGSYSGSIYSDGTFSGTHSGGSLSGTYGSFYGGCYSSTLSSCGTGGTTLSVAGGSMVSHNGYVTVSSGGTVYINSGYGYHTFTGSNLTIPGTLTAEGGKSRLIRTGHFGARLLYAYETPLPTFSDYGEARIDASGVCCICIEPIFAETVNEPLLPTVFLTPYGEGALYVDEIQHDTVTVKGTPGLRFAWETRYAQTNAEVQRLGLEKIETFQPEYRNYDMEANIDLEHAPDMAVSAQDYLTVYAAQAVDYGEAGYEYFTEFERSLEAA